MLSWKQCALLVITIMTSWQLMHLVTQCTVIICSSCFCENWALCVSWITYDDLYICIKTCYYIYIYNMPGILMFLGFINTRLASKHKLFSLSNLHSSTTLPTSPFFGERCALPHFLKNKQNSNSHLFCKVG